MQRGLEIMYTCIFMFLALVCGLFILFDINPVQIISDMIDDKRRKPKSLKAIIDESRGKSRHHFIVRQFQDTKAILELTERSDKYDACCRLSALLAVIGAVVGILFQNVLLIPVLALMGLLIPLLYIRFTANSYIKRLNREIETGLSIINSSYLRTENLTFAVKENLNNLNPPVHDVFAYFLVQVEKINPSIERALMDIRQRIKNDVFKQWCDAMILCQRDRTAKHMLEPIVEKLTDTRTVQGEMEAEMYNPSRTTLIMILLTVLNVPLLYFLSRTWFKALYTLPGKISLAVMAAAVLYAVYRAIRAARPLESKRGEA
jgi:Flp pilus assembly protein TadB